MKVDFKNPNVYYATVPVLAGLWAILAGFVFYPNSIEAWDKTQSESEAVEKQINQLVELQPERFFGRPVQPSTYASKNSQASVNLKIIVLREVQ